MIFYVLNFQKMTKSFYMPTLKNKLGEFTAIKEISTKSKKSTRPMFEIIGFVENKDLKKPKTIDDYYDDVASKIFKNWGNELFYLDSLSNTDVLISDGKTHHLSYLHKELINKGCSPIFSTNFNKCNLFNKSLSDIIKKDGNGCCIRVTTSDIEYIDFHKTLASLIDNLNISTLEVDLVIDLKSIYNSNININWVEGLINKIPNIHSWRSITLLSGAFPIDVSTLKRNAVSIIPRADWNLWSTLTNKSGFDILNFGDYSISNPALIPVKIGNIFLTPSANIRYTAVDNWIVLKGQSTKPNFGGFEQYFDLSKDLIKRKEFCSSSFSYGDSYIDKCAKKLVSKGSSTTWKGVVTNHHIEFVVNQLSSFGVL